MQDTEDKGTLDIEDAISRTATEIHRREQSVQSLYLDEHGREIPNPTPMQPPIGYKRAPTIAEQMRQMIKQASFEAAQAGAETEEEANDFDVDEEWEPSSQWEHPFDPDPALEVMLARASAPPPAAPTPPAPPPASTPEGTAPSSGAQK